ncbi:TetR family transcriptional regulator [Secundilactobacillus pentosiphilus]|uniref:TetR family transcriptional regulator n=1 Tax=Secundilactobacillus pentosiphilus TaxID=1714682 RepID=A0A1Z5IXV3_9LACO|nr:TetR/AcrR family transcriptional regulator [Secundilactobacillus pentosiphilus]GAX06388.1 TetR family transcriptional regulator [Secundilactobacillus pentosiphilus]
MKRGQLSREIILEKGLAVASESGLNGITYNGLAREIGIRPQSMYRYLDDIAAVKSGIVALYMQKLVAYLQQQVSDLTGKTALRQLAVSFIQFAQSGMPFTDMVWGISHYNNEASVTEAVIQLRQLTQRLIATVSQDETQVAANTALFLEFVIGHLALITARREPKLDQTIFNQNIDRIINQF